MKAITENFPFPEISKLELSHSSRNSFKSCPRKLEFRKIYNNSRRDDGLAASLGTALHNGIQNWLVYKDEELAIWEMIKAFPMKYQKSWADRRSLASAYTTLLHMMNWEDLDRYELAQIQKPDGTLVPAVEVGFILRIRDYPFYSDGRTIDVDYVGFIDLILYDRMEDEYLVRDIKTTTKTSDRSIEFQFDEQCLPYGLVLEAILGHDVNKGFRVDYWNVFIDPVEPKNLNYSFHKSQIDLRDWMQGYLFDLDAIRRYYNLGWFARNSNGCMSWNRPCVFFDFCSSRNPEVIEMMLQQDAENQKPNDRPEPWVVVELDYNEVA